MPRKLELKGERFGRLTVLRETGCEKGYYVWECMCDCGTIHHAKGFQLKAGQVKSCGCLRKIRLIERNTTHGKKDTRLYTIWCGMKERCNNINSINYKWYGEKGVSICKEWIHDFQAFYNWALSNGYEDGLTIDRIESDKGYSPENCRWITRSENTMRANLKRWACRK